MGAYIREMFKAVVVLGLAIGVPYFALSDREHLTEIFGPADGEKAPAEAGESPATGPSGPIYGLTETPDGKAPELPIMRLSEAVRFDLTPMSIEQRWPDFASRLDDGPYYAYSVPFSTGGDPHDVVGMLLYRFDNSNQLRQIIFRGGTDDYGPLVQTLQRYYGFVRRPQNEQSVLIFERLDAVGGQSSYVLIERAVGNISMKTPRRYDVGLVLERPTVQVR